MNYLNQMTNYLLFLVCFLIGCSSSSFKIRNQGENRIEFSLSPDRILLECEQLDDPNRSFGFMIHILDEKNTVLTAIQSNKLDKKSCLERIKKISLILQKGSQIYLGAIGSIIEPRQNLETNYKFPKHGTFNGNGRSIQFSVIANESGMCYSAHNGSEKPCPRDEFPIKAEK